MRTVSKLPGILRWFEIADKKTHILSPIEVAIDSVTKKNDQIRTVMAEYRSNDPNSNVSPLTMLLNGTVDAAVQGGLKKYEEVNQRCTKLTPVRLLNPSKIFLWKTHKSNLTATPPFSPDFVDT